MTKQLTRREVEASPMLTAEVRHQAVKIRACLALDGIAYRFGHRDTQGERDFAIRVLVAKGELLVDPTDARCLLAA